MTEHDISSGQKKPRWRKAQAEMALTWSGLRTRGLSRATTDPLRSLAIVSKAPRLPPLYIFSGSKPSPLDTVSYESDSKSNNDNTASPRGAPFLLPLPPPPPAPKSISVIFTYLRPPTRGGSGSFLPPGFGFRVMDEVGGGSGSSASRASPGPTPTGARLTRTGLRPATTAMVTQSPTTGTS